MYGVTLRQYLPHSSYYVGVAGPGSRRNISVFLGGTSDFTKYLPTSTNLTLCSKREHSGESVWGYQGACASEADEAEFRLEVAEILDHDTRKVTGCAAAEVSICTCPVPAPGLQSARGLRPQSFPGCR